MELKGYTNIPDWMLTLDLDVYETIILAVIYGFSQDGESTFKGSWKYLSDKAKCSRRKVATALTNLVDKKLIRKIDVDTRGVHLCEYAVTEWCMSCMGGAQGAWGSAQDAQGGACGAPNNIDNNIDINKDSLYKAKTSHFVKPSIEEIEQYCIERNNGIDAEVFFNFYEAKGWVVGNSPMKDWKAAVRTWEKRPAKVQSSGFRQRESVYEHNMRTMSNLLGK